MCGNKQYNGATFPISHPKLLNLLSASQCLWCLAVSQWDNRLLISTLRAGAASECVQCWRGWRFLPPSAPTAELALKKKTSLKEQLLAGWLQAIKAPSRRVFCSYLSSPLLSSLPPSPPRLYASRLAQPWVAASCGRASSATSSARRSRPSRRTMTSGCPRWRGTALSAPSTQSSWRSSWNPAEAGPSWSCRSPRSAMWLETQHEVLRNLPMVLERTQILTVIDSVFLKF